MTFPPFREGSTRLSEEIVADHLAATMSGRLGVEVVSPDPAAVLDRLPANVPRPERIPRLPPEHGTLVGGSPCRLPSATGVRFTYALSEGGLVSLYVLTRSEQLPRLPGQAGRWQGGVGRGSLRSELVLWSGESAVYALVGEIPADRLRWLASAAL